ncbi:hypothetical protein Vadar_002923 [Vaccinium darrowii]|uniref:Uncharacterized protein n=1 Tax=Vaccinium darrowii TaxID=229202 RepID=A0ACB7XG61_9ERIC|nr:hypothetical protein Vadar_002923 [Vaccinium darrowii]
MPSCKENKRWVYTANVAECHSGLGSCCPQIGRHLKLIWDCIRFKSFSRFSTPEREKKWQPRQELVLLALLSWAKTLPSTLLRKDFPFPSTTGLLQRLMRQLNEPNGKETFPFLAFMILSPLFTQSRNPVS